MTSITIETENADVAKKLIAFLKSISFIKSVVVNEVKDKPLTAADWVRPGRPATEKELEIMAKNMIAQEKAGKYFTADEVKKNAAKGLEQWRKKNLK